MVLFPVHSLLHPNGVVYCPGFFGVLLRFAVLQYSVMETGTIFVNWVVPVFVAYLLGSVSWSYVIGRVARGVDMTQVGDARIGAAFSARRLGLGWGILVGGLDFAKGAAAVALPLAMGLPDLSAFLAALAVVAGHNWSVFLGFKGGRGAAASFGVLAVVAAVPLAAGGLILALPHYLTRRSLFVLGMRRTTFLFAIWMGIVSLATWLDLGVGFLPDFPWSLEDSPLLACLPLPLLALNLMKRGQHTGEPAVWSRLPDRRVN